MNNSLLLIDKVSFCTTRSAKQLPYLFPEAISSIKFLTPYTIYSYSQIQNFKFAKIIDKLLTLTTSEERLACLIFRNLDCSKIYERLLQEFPTESTVGIGFKGRNRVHSIWFTQVLLRKLGSSVNSTQKRMIKINFFLKSLTANR